MNSKDYFASENCREEINKLSAERMSRYMESILARHYLACSIKTKSVSEHRFLKFIKNLLSCKDKYQSNAVKQMKYQKKYKEY